MIQESLLVLACANNNGCMETMAAYRVNNLEITQYYEEKAKQIQNEVPAYVINYIVPIMGIAGNVEARFNAGYNTTIGVKNDYISINYAFQY